MPRLPDPNRLTLLLAFAGLCCIAIGCGSRESPTSETDPTTETEPNAEAAPIANGVGNAPAVRAVAVTQQAMRKTTAQPATVHPYHQAELRARVGGYVESLTSDIGDVVTAGDVLAKISVPELETRRAVVAAQVERRRALETQAESGVRLAEAMVVSAEARLEQSRAESTRANASLSAAEAEFQRTSDLVARQSLQQRVLDEVTMRRDAELANVAAAKSAVHSTEAEVTVANAKLNAAQADLRAAKAETEIALRELEEAEVMVGYATIRAPFSGVITERHADPGDLVIPDDNTPSTMPLFTMIQRDRVRVHVAIPEADATLVNPGDPVSLTFPAFPEEALETTVTRVSGSLDPNTRTMLVECEIENGEHRLVPGMFAMASITLSTKADVTVLPARSIRFDEAGKAFVYVLQPDDTVALVEVATGSDDGRLIEVVSPLRPGERVVDAHRDRFRDGQAVQVLPPN